jgi:hypothetical protein
MSKPKTTRLHGKNIVIYRFGDLVDTSAVVHNQIFNESIQRLTQEKQSPRERVNTEMKD